jgi:predicted nucleotidyltransferase component of viral defense system
MAINITSLKSKLLYISKEKKVDFQVILNRFGAEQFLARLSQSSVINQFVFKGGSLLMYLIKTNRKTRDIDFSIKSTRSTPAIASISLAGGVAQLKQSFNQHLLAVQYIV